MLQIEHLGTRFKGKAIIEDVSFTLNSGEVTALIGMNGSGKTTIINTIMQLIPLQAGTITIDGAPLTRHNLDQIAYIPDKLPALRLFTVAETIEYMVAYYPMFNKQRANELVSFFRLETAKRLRELSKGNQAKLNMVLGIALQTKYLLMDEPFSGIDLLAREEIIAVFDTLFAEKRGVLISTHEINEIEYIVDRAVFLHEGRIIETLDVENMREEEGISLTEKVREVYES